MKRYMHPIWESTSSFGTRLLKVLVSGAGKNGLTPILNKLIPSLPPILHTA